MIEARVRHRLTFRWTDWSPWTRCAGDEVRRVVIEVKGPRVALAVLMRRHVIEHEFRPAE